MSQKKNKRKLTEPVSESKNNLTEYQISQSENHPPKSEKAVVENGSGKSRQKSLIPVGVAIILYLFLWKSTDIKVIDPWYKAGVLLDSATAASDNIRKEIFLDSAKKMIPPVLKKFPYHARVHFIWGYYFQLNNLWDSAVAEYLTAAKLDSGGTINAIWPQAEKQIAYIYFTRSNNLIQSGKVDSAKIILWEGIDFAPHNEALPKQLGALYFNTGRLDSSINYYNRALTINPRDADSYNDLGVILQNKGDYGKALEFYNTSLKLNPQQANAAKNLNNLRQIMQNNVNQNQEKK